MTRIALIISMALVLAVGGLDGVSDGDRASSEAHAFPVPPPPGIDPPGANDFSCEGRSGHRTPVVLVHGMLGNMTENWKTFSPALAHEGWCVFALDLPKRFTVRLQESARALRSFVNRVRRATGRQRVSIVGHSIAGGPLPRLYIKGFGGKGKVRDVIGIGPGNYGTVDPFEFGVPDDGTCLSCVQFTSGSHFLSRLNRGTDVPGRRVDYTVMQTIYDEFVKPHTSGFLRGPRDRVTNITLQDRCPQNPSTHFQLLDDRVVLQWIRNALRRPGPADPRFRPSC